MYRAAKGPLWLKNSHFLGSCVQGQGDPKTPENSRKQGLKKGQKRAQKSLFDEVPTNQSNDLFVATYVN